MRKGRSAVHRAVVVTDRCESNLESSAVVFPKVRTRIIIPGSLPPTQEEPGGRTKDTFGGWPFENSGKKTTESILPLHDSLRGTSFLPEPRVSRLSYALRPRPRRPRSEAGNGPRSI